MHLRLHEVRVFETELYTRMPFRYGIATVTQLPHVFVQLEVSIDGARHAGFAADHLPPKWFTKNPATPFADDIAEMRRVIASALRLAGGLEGGTPFTLWKQLYDAQSAWGRSENLAPLLTNFGTSLVERALLDAVCRAAGRPFHEMLHTNALGIRLSDLHAELAGQTPADLLPSTAPRLLARHTVGLSDPLTDDEIAPGDAAGDGLPQSLAACIETYGLRHFKIKVGGDIDRDVQRLHQIAPLLQNHAPADFAFSLDGNESYQPASFRIFWDTVTGSAALGPFLRHLLFVEQPLHRDSALGADAGALFAAWPDRPPIIIDESDAELSSLPIALALGYAGTSHKNCKGIFKGVANACLLEHHRRRTPPRALLLSGEDLSTVGPSLLADLAVQASLGIGSVERNGHHYFAGLSQFPLSVQQETLSAHPDLFHQSAAGWPTLTITEGQIELGSVNAAPLGVGFVLDPASLDLSVS